MPFIADAYFDLAIAGIVSAGTALSLCSQEPTTYAEATTTYELGIDTSVSCGAAANGATNGRRTIVPSADVVANASGTATHWALHNNSNTLVATGALASSVAMTNGLTYTTASFSITFPDAA